jgi:hypothetical protein
MMSRHNHLAVWVSVILSQVLGALTYMFILAQAWEDGQPGRKAEFDAMRSGQMEMGPGFWTPFIWDILGSILLCYFISWLVIRLNIASAGKGFELGLWITLGVLVKAILGHYGFLGMSTAVTAIDFGFTAVVVLISSMIIGGWRKKGSVVTA